MERVMGIEPTYAAWKAAVLPLNYTRVPHSQNHNRLTGLVNLLIFHPGPFCFLGTAIEKL